MHAYILRRLLLIIPTLFGIMVLNFAIIQAAPGGPVEQAIAKIKGTATGAASRIGGGGAGGDLGMAGQQAAMGKLQTRAADSAYRGAQGLDPDFIKELEKQYGFDKPALTRFWQMLGDYVTLDFGDSSYRDVPVLDLILEKMPVSISLGLWTTLLVYLISIPLGIAKAVRDGSAFDIWTSSLIVVGYAIPSFLFAILLIILFSGGQYWQIFPLRGLVSEGWDAMSWPAKIADYFWHIALPVTAMVISGFASLTMLTKNSFMDEIGKQYVLTARAKGLSERQVLTGHVFRNAMLIVIAGFPGAILSILFTGSLLIEVIFSLDGLGLLGFEAAISRDYPVVFGTLFVFTLLSLIFKLIGDMAYVMVDPRIDFESRG
ncbi:MAG: microcin C ABC transporter permease YejB [Rickettsiales bacterium]|nr:microcin C ABC transporter permease YejB [Rickettsiales bacterium]